MPLAYPPMSLKITTREFNGIVNTAQESGGRKCWKYKNGKIEKKEFYYGSSFLSQSGRFVNIEEDVSDITIFDNKGGQRTIHF